MRSSCNLCLDWHTVLYLAIRLLRQLKTANIMFIPPQYRSLTRVVRFSLGLLTVALLHGGAYARDDTRTSTWNTRLEHREDGTGNFNWTDIEPSRKLRWHVCYNGAYECARLDVPMDWLDPTDDKRVVLAVSKIRATDTDNYKGVAFFNPGGPGVSGIWALQDHGALIQDIIGQNYDLISWDTRGTGLSVPRADCWGSEEKRRLWALQDVGVVGSHPGIVSDVFARAVALSQTCERNMNASGLLQHASTASTARDLLELMQQVGHDKLNFWGYSYGTISGGVFASMYPNKVGRIVSDGKYEVYCKCADINLLLLYG